MEHDLNFEVLSIRFSLYSGYNLNNIQQEHLKLASPLLERNSPPLEDLDKFLTEFNGIFGENIRV
jgi:hypothetical protein